MFKSKKLVGVSLVLGTVWSTFNSLVTSANENMKDIPVIGWGDEGVDIIPKELSDLVGQIRSKLSDDGNLINAAPLMEEAENLVRKHNLDIFLPWQDLTPYEALFDLSYCEDLDEQYCYLYEKKGVPEEVEKIINCETYYTNVISSFRKDLREGGTEEEIEYTKRKLVVFFKERDLVRKKLALCVAKYSLKLEKKLIGAGEKNTSNIKSEKEQSLVRANAVSKNSWGLLDIVFAIKDKVKTLLNLRKEKEEFVSKEEDLKMEAKVQETEFSLSLLVKRFLDFVRRSDSIGGYEKKDEGINSTNLLTDESTNEN